MHKQILSKQNFCPFLPVYSKRYYFLDHLPNPNVCCPVQFPLFSSLKILLHFHGILTLGMTEYQVTLRHWIVISQHTIQSFFTTSFVNQDIKFLWQNNIILERKKVYLTSTLYRPSLRSKQDEKDRHEIHMYTVEWERQVILLWGSKRIVAMH